MFFWGPGRAKPKIKKLFQHWLGGAGVVRKNLWRMGAGFEKLYLSFDTQGWPVNFGSGGMGAMRMNLAKCCLINSLTSTVTPSVCETLKPVCVTLRALPKTNKTNIKPSIKPVHKMHNTVKTGIILKETSIDFSYYYARFYRFYVFCGLVL